MICGKPISDMNLKGCTAVVEIYVRYNVNLVLFGINATKYICLGETLM